MSIKAAAKALGVPERNLYKRADEGAIRVERRASGRTRLLVDLEELRADLAALRCQGPGCHEPVTNAGDFCSHACSCRRYAPETRNCAQCGELFEVPGHRAKEAGAARFCKPACWAAWRWANRPESFPQAERRGEEWTCAGCGRTRYRPPSHLHVKVCAECIGDAHHDRTRIPEAMHEQGLIGTTEAARLIFRESTWLRRSGRVSLEHRQFGGLVRVGVPARELGRVRYEDTGSKDLYRQLAKHISAGNGTEFGRPRIPEEIRAAILELKLAEPGLGVRKIADRLHVSKSHVQRVLAAVPKA